MHIKLEGNTLSEGYFDGIVLPPFPGRWIVRTENCTARAGDKIQADTSKGAFTVTLPATPSIGSVVLIEDARLTWDLNNLTITGNGQKINGTTSNYTASVVGNKITFIYVSTSYGWSIQ